MDETSHGISAYIWSLRHDRPSSRAIPASFLIESVEATLAAHGISAARQKIREDLDGRVRRGEIEVLWGVDGAPIYRCGAVVTDTEVDPNH